MTGAEFIAKDLGMKVDAAVVEQLGTARKVAVAATATTLIADAASKEEIEMRIAQVSCCLFVCLFVCCCGFCYGQFKPHA